jgi:hypothetical protein
MADTLPMALDKVSLVIKAWGSDKGDSLFVRTMLGFFHVSAGSLH